MERFAWEVMTQDGRGSRRVAIVIGGKVRWEEWYEAIAAPAAGRNFDGFTPKGHVRGGPRPKTINCVLCHEDAPVKPRGKVPMICDACRAEGLFPALARA